MTKEAFFATTRSFIHANLMLKSFNKTETDIPITDFNNYFSTAQGAYLLLWYALLFNVIAFLKNQRALPKSIEDDVDKVYEGLRQCRHAVFHITPTFFDEKFMILAKPKAFKIIQKIHFSLSEFFDTELQKYGNETSLSWRLPKPSGIS